MEVDEPHAFILDTETGGSLPRVLINRGVWETHKRIREVLTPLEVTFNLESITPKALADLLLVTASYTTGWIELRITSAAVAIYYLLDYISVVPYKITAYPGTFSMKFPAKVGSNKYEIEPIGGHRMRPLHLTYHSKYHSYLLFLHHSVRRNSVAVDSLLNL